MEKIGVEKHNDCLRYDHIEGQVKNLQGKVLTVIDAVFSEGEQRKAVKDLINSKFSEQLDWISELSRGYGNRPVALGVTRKK